MALRQLFNIEPQPRKGLLAFEWVIIGYIILTLVLMTLRCDGIMNTEAMVWGRVRIAAAIVTLWATYRLMPCPLTMALRVFVQLAMLGWWYPDTYELNRCLPNLDHIASQAEQWLFGCQPSLRFSELCPWPWFSEMLDIGYVSYYPMMVAVMLVFFFTRYEDFLRCSLTIIGSFFLYYIVFDLLPVVGPTYYFRAIGIDQALSGVFPALGNYFNSHELCLPTPGFTDGIGYWAVEVAKVAGERPTAAFPSSHAGVATVCLLLACQLKSKQTFYIMLPFYISLCLATVYIQAHYAIDAIAGIITGVIFFLTLFKLTGKKTTNHN